MYIVSASHHDEMVSHFVCFVLLYPNDKQSKSQARNGIDTVLSDNAPNAYL